MRPCPFCGSSNVGFAYETHDHDNTTVYISCGACSASGPDHSYRRSTGAIDEDEALAYWNQRRWRPAGDRIGMSGAETAAAPDQPAMALPAMRLSVLYRTAAWRVTTPVDAAYGEIGVGFNLLDEATSVRLRLTLRDAISLRASLDHYLQQHFQQSSAPQSATSAGNPSSAVSMRDPKDQV